MTRGRVEEPRSPYRPRVIPGGARRTAGGGRSKKKGPAAHSRRVPGASLEKAPDLPVPPPAQVKKLDQDAVPASDAAPAQGLLDEEGLSAGMWLDLALSKETGAGTTVISKTATPMQFALEVPSALQAPERSYALIRSHEGTAALLAQGTAIVLNAKSNEFSTYVIACNSPSPAPGPTPGPTPRTDDPLSSALPIALVLLAGALFGMARLSKS